MPRQYENQSNQSNSSRHGNAPYQFDPVTGAWGSMHQSGSCSTAGRVARHAIGLLGGVAIGAGALYLLDPDKGPDRRHHLADAASDAIDRTSDTVRDTLGVLGRGASRAGSSLSEKGSELFDSLSSSSSHGLRKQRKRLMNQVRDRIDEISHHGRHRADSMRDTAGGWFDSARSHLPSRRFFSHYEGVSGTTATLSGLAALALGAGAMWLFDPRVGRSRRAWIEQKATHALHETGDFMRATGRHLRNRTKGYSHRAGDAISSYMPGSGYGQQSSGELSSAQNTLPRERAGAVGYGLDVTKAGGTGPCP